ncbi:MAG: STAS domain-containing protein [Candidatus Sulfotelmatobacter sp.]
METAIGVFTSRDRAARAVGELLNQHVPEVSIVFLTRSESEAQTVGKKFGAGAGASTGATVGIAVGLASTLLVPGVGAVFAIGYGAAALLGLVGAGIGSAVGKALTEDAGTPAPTAEHKCSEDVAFFREVLREGRSLIVVRTDSHEIATVACGVLDSLGLGTEPRAAGKMQTTIRQIDDVAILGVSGRITLGEGNVMLREMVRELMDKGSKKILLNLGEVQYVDSSGVGELVRTYTTVRNQGGQFKLVNLSQRVNDLLQMTKLSAVFDIEKDEASALKSLGARSPSQSAA